MCACVRVCVCMCVHACARARARVRVRMHAHALCAMHAMYLCTNIRAFAEHIWAHAHACVRTSDLSIPGKCSSAASLHSIAGTFEHERIICMDKCEHLHVHRYGNLKALVSQRVVAEAVAWCALGSILCVTCMICGVKVSKTFVVGAGWQ